MIRLDTEPIRNAVKFVPSPCTGCTFHEKCAAEFLACEAVNEYTQLRPWKLEQRADPCRAYFALSYPDHIKSKRMMVLNEKLRGGKPRKRSLDMAGKMS